MHFLQSEVKKKWPQDANVSYLIPSSFIFLRIFCAALLSPHLFNLADAPSKAVQKNLTVVSKTLMNLATMLETDRDKTSTPPSSPPPILTSSGNTRKSSKDLSPSPLVLTNGKPKDTTTISDEEYFHQNFVLPNTDRLKKYIDSICTLPTEPRFEANNIDLATEVATIEAFLYTTIVTQKNHTETPIIKELLPIIKSLRVTIDKYKRDRKLSTQKIQKTVQIVV